MGCGCQERKQQRAMTAAAGPVAWIVTYPDGSADEFANYDDAQRSSTDRGGVISSR